MEPAVAQEAVIYDSTLEEDGEGVKEKVEEVSDVSSDSEGERCVRDVVVAGDEYEEGGKEAKEQNLGERMWDIAFGIEDEDTLTPQPEDKVVEGKTVLARPMARAKEWKGTSNRKKDRRLDDETSDAVGEDVRGDVVVGGLADGEAGQQHPGGRGPDEIRRKLPRARVARALRARGVSRCGPRPRVHTLSRAVPRAVRVDVGLRWL